MSSAYVEVANRSRGTVLGTSVRRARTFATRFRGLMLQSSLDCGEGLIIAPCTGIHMFFMRFAIDAVFYDHHECVLAVYEDLRPWRISSVHLRACGVIELPVGVVRSSGTKVGDQLEFLPRDDHGG